MKKTFLIYLFFLSCKEKKGVSTSKFVKNDVIELPKELTISDVRFQCLDLEKESGDFDWSKRCLFETDLTYECLIQGKKYRHSAITLNKIYQSSKNETKTHLIKTKKFDIFGGWVEIKDAIQKVCIQNAKQHDLDMRAEPLTEEQKTNLRTKILIMLSILEDGCQADPQCQFSKPSQNPTFYFSKLSRENNIPNPFFSVNGRESPESFCELTFKTEQLTFQSTYDVKLKKEDPNSVETFFEDHPIVSRRYDFFDQNTKEFASKQLDIEQKPILLKHFETLIGSHLLVDICELPNGPEYAKWAFEHSIKK